MEIRHAFRMLVKDPGFTVVAAVTLALGIGLNTVVFTVYESIALKPLAVRAPEEIVRVVGRYDGPSIETFSYQEYEKLRDHGRSLASAVATSTPQSVLCVLPDSSPNEAQAVQARFASANYFEALGVSPSIGRAFSVNVTGVVVSRAF